MSHAYLLAYYMRLLLYISRGTDSHDGNWNIGKARSIYSLFWEVNIFPVPHGFMTEANRSSANEAGGPQLIPCHLGWLAQWTWTHPYHINVYSLWNVPIFKALFTFMCISVFCLHVYLCVSVFSVHEGKRQHWNPMEQELQMVDVGKPAQVLCRSSQFS